jgi:TusA-related sulfurtransferase
MLHVEKEKPEAHAETDPQPPSRTGRVLDLRGMIVPLALLKITQEFRALQGGETLEILGTDHDTRKDALRVLGESPCEVVFICNEKDHYVIRLKKDTEII